jgi:hypothetical protein
MMAYVLIAVGGSYEGAWRSNVAASRDLHKIELLKAEKEFQRDAILEIKAKVEEFSMQWRLDNPFDTSSIEKVLNVPKWPAGMSQKMITKEMSDHRECIRKFNQEAQQRNAARQLEYREKNYNAEKEFARALGLFDLVKEDSTRAFYCVALSLSDYSGTYYEIEEIEEI